MGLFFVCNWPFVVFGSWIGRDPNMEKSSKLSSRIPRMMPSSNPWFLGYCLNIPIASIIPTLVVYYEI